MLNNRNIESIKVIIRKNRILYRIAKVLYLPINIQKNLKEKKYARKRAKEIIKNLTYLPVNRKCIYYFGVPTHENLGDAAQMICIKKWIKENYSDFKLIEIETMPTYYKKLRRQLINTIKPYDRIITESGATFCNRHQDHKMHRFLMKEFKNTRILMMPETIDLTDNHELDITAKLFNSNKNVLLLARDIVSFNMIDNIFDSKRILLFPDIVTTMIGNSNTIINEQGRNGILVCKRLDGEKKYSDKDLSFFMKSLKNISDIVKFTDTNFEKNYEYTMSHVDEEVERKIQLFSNYKIVVTDRFHGMIFALVSNTPVIVLPTIGHKVYEGAKWFSKIYPDSVFFYENLLEAEKKVSELYVNYHKINNYSWSKEKYFDRLKELFEKIGL